MELKKSTLSKIFKSRSIGILLVLAVMVLILSLSSDVFLSWKNIISIFQQTAIKGIIAIGMTVVIISGTVDLSIGSTVALSALFAANIMVKYGGDYIWLAVLAAVITGAICGCINGVFIAVLKLQPFIVTMSTMNIYRGIHYIISGARIVRGLPSEFTSFMNSMNDTFPVPVIILFSVALVMHIILKYTKYGRYVFAVGGNEEAARLSGVNVKLVRTVNYTIMGIASAICAIVLIGRLGSVDSTAGEGYQMDAIAAAAVGGASLTGGRGTIGGTLLGALLLSILANSLTLLNVQPFYQVIATGAIVILAAIIDQLSNKN